MKMKRENEKKMKMKKRTKKEDCIARTHNEIKKARQTRKTAYFFLNSLMENVLVNLSARIKLRLQKEHNSLSIFEMG